MLIIFQSVAIALYDKIVRLAMFYNVVKLGYVMLCEYDLGFKIGYRVTSTMFTMFFEKVLNFHGMQNICRLTLTKYLTSKIFS